MVLFGLHAGNIRVEVEGAEDDPGRGCAGPLAYLPQPASALLTGPAWIACSLAAPGKMQRFFDGPDPFRLFCYPTVSSRRMYICSRSGIRVTWVLLKAGGG
jgi:hypothetical protein